MDKISTLISRLEHQVIEIFGKNSCGHDINHLRRTLNYAMEIQKSEGGDPEVIAVASFIHDIHRIMENELGRKVAPKESLPKIKELITGLPLTQKQKDHVCFVVEHHEENVIGKSNPITDIETLIVQDADAMDIIGAVGIARSIKYSTVNNIPIYRPDTPLYYDDKQKNDNDVSTIHYFYNKALRLGENMNTKTAKVIAKPKTKLTKDFVEMFLKEWI